MKLKKNLLNFFSSANSKNNEVNNYCLLSIRNATESLHLQSSRNLVNDLTGCSFLNYDAQRSTLCFNHTLNDINYFLFRSRSSAGIYTLPNTFTRYECFFFPFSLNRKHLACYTTVELPFLRVSLAITNYFAITSNNVHQLQNKIQVLMCSCYIDTVSRKMVILINIPHLLIGKTRRRLTIYHSQSDVLSLRILFYGDIATILRKIFRRPSTDNRP